MTLLGRIKDAVHSFGPFPQTSAEVLVCLEGCIDEDKDIDTAGVRDFGTPGTFVTVPEGGNVNLYPLEVRAVVSQHAPVVHAILGEISFALTGQPIFGIDHEECGALAAQGIKNQEKISSLTQMAMQEPNSPNVRYGGTIVHSEVPQPTLIDGLVEAHLIREQAHTHLGEFVVGTVGGGVDHVTELPMIAERVGGDGFTASMDYLAVLRTLGVPDQDVTTLAGLGPDIADKIADGVARRHGEGSGVVLFDAQLLPPAMTDQNIDIARQVLSSLGYTEIPLISRNDLFT